jgi:hypothetical protein
MPMNAVLWYYTGAGQATSRCIPAEMTDIMDRAVDAVNRKQERLNIPVRSAAAMVFRYVGRKFSSQIRAAAFIVLYLFLFQTIVAGKPAGGTARIAFGIFFVIIGLTFFMEGLVLGLMPLGEAVGLQLPRRRRLSQVLIFGLAAGFVATLAEPAISTLQAAGSGTPAWESPLLFYLLETRPQRLISVIGAGVAAAVALSLLRYAWDIKLAPYLLSVLAAALILTIISSFHSSLRSVIALAWDSGAVTTGPVTVPLVLTLGIGVSRSTGRQGGASGGYGTIALASLFPVISVLLYSLILSGSLPAPMNESQFFSPQNREAVLTLFSEEQELERYAYTAGGAEGRSSYYADEQRHREAVQTLNKGRDLLGSLPLEYWMRESASQEELSWLEGASAESSAPSLPSEDTDAASAYLQVFREEFLLALRAVLPLTVLLLLVLIGLLCDRPRSTDEFLLGIIITAAGMMFLTAGIRLGLVPLGDTVGSELTRIYEAQASEEEHIIEDFDPSLVFEAVDTGGERSRYFYLTKDGELIPVPFNPAHYDQGSGTYTHVQVIPPLFGSGLTLAGLIFVLLFAFGLGYGSTLAEPALNALGRNVEEISVGTVTQRGVVRAVSVGVGLGIAVGIVRLLYAFPVEFLLIPGYLLLIPLTIWGEPDFTGIAWDSGGATTGPVTVPLVMAMGLGISATLSLADGFGLLASASLFPVLTVQLYGMAVRLRQRRTTRLLGEEGEAHE